MSEQSTACEYAGCDHEGWTVLHFGPKMTPPLRIACRTHMTSVDLAAFTTTHEAAAVAQPEGELT